MCFDNKNIIEDDHKKLAIFLFKGKNAILLKNWEAILESKEGKIFLNVRGEVILAKTEQCVQGI